MKDFFFIFILFVIFIPGEGFLGGLTRKCSCQAVSDTIHIPFHSWDISSCTFCSCNNPAMVNCEKACEDMVKNYANAGCGKTISGSKTVYKFHASSCSSGVGNEIYTCA